MLPRAGAARRAPAMPQRVALPVESLQHPLSVYDELLEVGMNLQHERIAELCEQLKLAGLGARVAGAGAGRRAR